MYNFDLDVNYDTDDEYREQLLKVFGFDCYDDKIIEIQKTIFNDIKENKSLNDLLTKASNSVLSEDLEIGLVLLFSYSYFKSFHYILKKFKTCNEVLEEDIDKLKKMFVKK